MTIDRNTIARRKRGTDGKHAAKKKRERRASRKHDAGKRLALDGSDLCLSPAEHAVLTVFRKWLMTPGKMLCFSRADLDTLKMPLSQLASKGLVVKERFKGGYSLTKTGFDAMKDGP